MAYPQRLSPHAYSRTRLERSLSDCMLTWAVVALSQPLVPSARLPIYVIYPPSPATFLRYLPTLWLRPSAWLNSAPLIRLRRNYSPQAHPVVVRCAVPRLSRGQDVGVLSIIEPGSVTQGFFSILLSAMFLSIGVYMWPYPNCLLCRESGLFLGFVIVGFELFHQAKRC